MSKRCQEMCSQAQFSQLKLIFHHFLLLCGSQLQASDTSELLQPLPKMVLPPGHEIKDLIFYIFFEPGYASVYRLPLTRKLLNQGCLMLLISALFFGKRTITVFPPVTLFSKLRLACPEIWAKAQAKWYTMQPVLYSVLPFSCC